MGSMAREISVSGDRCSQDHWMILTSLVLDGISSPHTRRAYSQALDEFLIWFLDAPGRDFNKATVQKYRSELETKGLAPSSINVRLSAIRRLALEAADNGLMAQELAAGIARARGAKRSGVRLGHWLSANEATRLLAAPDLTTIKGIRDGALIGLLLGAGLRRAEVAGLNVDDIQQREGRWLIADLIGKHARVRTVPIPLWAQIAVARWESVGSITAGPVFRRVNRHGQVTPEKISVQAVFEIVRTYAKRLGMQVSPHDLRRTFARLVRIPMKWGTDSGGSGAASG